MQSSATPWDSLVTPTEWDGRKTFVGFGPGDEEILAELHLVARAYADEVMDELYARWLRAEEVRRFFADRRLLDRVKSLQREYFIRLTGGDYGVAYLHDRLRIGGVHHRIGLSPRWYMGAYSIYLQIVLPKVLSAFEHDRSKRSRAVIALLKLVSLDQELAMTSYFAHQEAPRRA